MTDAIATKKLSDRLERLVCSCSEGSVEKYSDDLKQLVNKVMNLQQIDKQNRLLKALANQTRLEILNILKIREMCVCEIMVALDLTQPTASHHLHILENVGVVNDRKEGKWVYYSLTKDTAELLLSFLNKSIK